MSSREPRDVYFIPPNFIDTGTLFGGSIRLRNAVEAAVLAAGTGIPLLYLPLPFNWRLILVIVIALPLAILAVVGIEGDSLTEFLAHWLRFMRRRRIVTATEEGNLLANKRRHLRFIDRRKYRVVYYDDEAALPKGAKTVRKRSTTPGKLAHSQTLYDLLPITKIENGIVATTDGRYLKILEIKPINFLLRSAREQRNVIQAFASMLKIAPVKLQIKSVAQKAAVNAYLAGLRADEAREPDPAVIPHHEDYIRFVSRLGSRDAVSRRFFVIFQYESPVNERHVPYAEIVSMLETTARNFRTYPDVDDAAEHAAILCDNLYRRIENPAGCGAAGIHVSIAASGNIQPFTPLAISQGTYNPTSTILGEFTIMEPGRAAPKKGAVIKAEDFAAQYRFSAAPLTAAEESLIPRLPPWYVIPEEVVLACRHAKETTGSAQPMRNFMFRGPAGTGKTEGAKAFAAGVHRPYVSLTCNANFEIYDFLGQMMPDVQTGSVRRDADLPSLQDIQMDPASAYCAMTGEYREDVTDSDVFDKLLEVMALRAKAEQHAQARQSFRYVDTPFVQALRRGYVVEIQEPTVIANPGVMVGLNSLLDRCNSITLPTGEVIERHPDCVVIVTTNIGYEGCRDMNQSVLSRMNLIIDFDQPDTATMANRVIKLTGCTDKGAVRQMVECVGEIIRCCREKSITDGSCGMRELIAWVQSFMVTHDILAAAKYTVLSAVSGDPENREEILSSCLLPRFDP